MNPDETKHQFLTHTNCKVPNCTICSGDVKICLICGGVETPNSNSLTTNCCEKPLTAEQKKDIEDGHLDYRNFRWHDKRIGPTIKEIIDQKGIAINVGHIACAKDPKGSNYICVGVYENSLGQTMYAWHEIMTATNRENVGFMSLIHYKKFVELFGEL